MTAEDFEAQFARLRLDAVPADASMEATFSSGAHDATVISGPRAEHEELDVGGTLGTLPKLSLAMPDAALVGDPKAELVVVRVLGEGGMGRVLLAQQHSLGREVAVKVLKPSVASEAAAAALVEEARTTGSLEHPNVVPVYALARDGNGLPALLMKRVDGVSWRTLIHNPRHPANARIARGGDQLEAHLEVLIQICNAVAHAHRRGVIHRDLKPANVLIGELGEVYVADWGIAIQKAKMVPGQPRLVGTPAYLAPEMVTGDATLTDERTDVYLLGGTLHEVLTLLPTHQGTTIHDVLQRAWAAVPPVLPPEIPAELAQICARALAADPRDRFQSALELRDALRLFLRHRGSSRLSDAAAERLVKLEQLAARPLNPEEDRGWYALVSECRFGFAQALLADATSAVAHAGLERCLAVAARRELDRGAADAARAFVAEMKEPSAALREALAALEAKGLERNLQEARFRRQAYELDPLVYVHQRNRVLGAVLVAIVGVIGVFGFPNPVRAAIDAGLGTWARVLPMTIILSVFLVGLAVARKAVLATRINRQLMATIGTGAVSVWVGRILFAALGLPLRVALIHDAITIAAITAICAFLLHWSFAPTAVIFLAGGIVSMFVPEQHALTTFSAITVVGLVVCIWMFQHWRRELAKDAAP